MHKAVCAIAAMACAAGLTAPAGSTDAYSRPWDSAHAATKAPRWDAAVLDKRILLAHNRARAALGIEPLRWDPALAQNAAQWGRELVRRGVFEHSHNRANVGENLWEGTPGAYSPEQMVGRWLGEKRVFKAGIFPNNSITGDWSAVGHYTQLMWRRSTALGCALVPGPHADVLVCRYAPAGNVYGEVPF